MLDHLSYFPSPKGKEAAGEIFNRIISWPESTIVKTQHDKNILKKHIISIIHSNPPKCSYSGWIMGELDDYVNHCTTSYKKKVLLRRKIKGIIKSLVFLHLIYKETIERFYAPTGIFETKMSNYWNPILKNHQVWPPPPPKND
tara:strand:+ start:616 stop:1044 length:429 start_codon:yes stop_codon:yes gene_type:complete